MVLTQRNHLREWQSDRVYVSIPLWFLRNRLRVQSSLGSGENSFHTTMVLTQLSVENFFFDASQS